MPIGKNAETRYKILDRCFSNFKRKYTIDDLLERVNEVLRDLEGTEIELRQLRLDIKYMRDRVTWKAPIKAYPFEGRKCYYRYEDPNFSIFNNELSEEETSNLRATLEMLKRFRGNPANAWMEEVISNLEYRFGASTPTKNLIGFAQNDRLKGLEHLSKLIDATINCQPMNIGYKSYKDVEYKYLIHPYYMKQYNERWFLFGYNEQFKGISNVALDRIISISPANVQFRKNDDIDFDSYFNDIVGVSVPSTDKNLKAEFIRLRFSQMRFPYVVSKPIHPTQKTIDENACEIELHVIPTKELTQQILSFGEDVEVVSPLTYREYISKKIAESYKKYFAVQKGCTDNIELCSVK